MTKEQLMSDVLNFNSPDEHGWITSYIIEAVWIIIINIVTILTFSINRRFFGRSVILIVNLSVADLVFGLCFLAQGIYNSVLTKQEAKYHALTVVLEALVYFCSCSSGFCLILIALERVFATFSPFRHRVSDLKPYAVAIAISWCFATTVGLLHYFTPVEWFHLLTYFYATGILCGLATVIVSYIAIFIKVRTQNQIHDRVTETSNQRERNMAFTLMIVTFSSLSTWLPIGVLFGVYKFASVQVPVWVAGLSFMALASNSFINTIIYTLRMVDFRKALFQLMCKCSRYRIQRPVPRNTYPLRPVLQNKT